VLDSKGFRRSTMKFPIILVGILISVSVIMGGCVDQQETSPSAETPSSEESGDTPPETPDNESGFAIISATEAKQLIDENPGVVIIDVMSFSSYAKGHLPGAVNYPLGDGSLDEAIPNLNKNGHYLVYCRIGSSSLQEAQKLIDAGFMNVYQLEGGYLAWLDAGYSVEYAYSDISPEDAKELIDENQDVIIIDVSPAYDNGHLPGAVSYYIGDGSLDSAIPMLDKSATYLVYCHAESASRQGAQKLVDAGFMSVYRLEGEYRAWVDAGYPVEQ
jgi:rhodanese-related sulfurtransferase